MPIQAAALIPLIQVFDMRASLTFYRDALGFSVAMQSCAGDVFDWCLLTLGGATLMLNTAYEAHERPAAPDPSRAAAHHDTALFIDCADVDGAHAHVVARGIPAAPPVVRDYGMKQLTVVDPDGYEVCFQQRVGA
jgi:catechol 2,3-dioxygenase-like lactoylglutathione lyase family enzyme